MRLYLCILHEYSIRENAWWYLICCVGVLPILIYGPPPPVKNPLMSAKISPFQCFLEFWKVKLQFSCYYPSCLALIRVLFPYSLRYIYLCVWPVVEPFIVVSTSCWWMSCLFLSTRPIFFHLGCTAVFQDPFIATNEIDDLSVKMLS